MFHNLFSYPQVEECSILFQADQSQPLLRLHPLTDPPPGPMPPADPSPEPHSQADIHGMLSRNPGKDIRMCVLCLQESTMSCPVYQQKGSETRKVGAILSSTW